MHSVKFVSAPTVILTSLFLSLGLTACGGGSSGGGGSNETVTGQFIDSAVGGLAYSCSSGKSGVTDNNGNYTCNKGDTVTFSINGFIIGSATASAVIRPDSLTSDSAQALNVAQLLQTLDADNNPANGISIAQSGPEYDAMASMASANVTLAQADFDTSAAAYLGVPLVDETTAQAHLDQTIASLTFDAASIKAAFAGKTAYPSKPTPAYSEEWVMAADGMSAIGTGVDGYGSYGPGTLTFSYTDTSFTVSTASDGPVTFTVSAINSTYIETNLGKVYYTQAEAYTDAIIAAVAGKKLYPQQTSRSYTEEWVFDASGTSAIVSGVDANGAYTDHVVLTYNGATFDATSQDQGGTNTFTVIDITSNQITLKDAGGTQFGVFNTQAAAYVGL